MWLVFLLLVCVSLASRADLRFVDTVLYAAAGWYPDSFPNHNVTTRSTGARSYDVLSRGAFVYSVDIAKDVEGLSMVWSDCKGHVLIATWDGHDNYVRISGNAFSNVCVFSIFN